MLTINNVKRESITDALDVCAVTFCNNTRALHLSNRSTPRRLSWRLAIGVNSSAGLGARLIKGRHSQHPCRHVYRVFLGVLFDLCPDAVVYTSTALFKEIYSNRDDFLRKWREPRPSVVPRCICQIPKGGA